MNQAGAALDYAEIEVFIPGPGENAKDPGDSQRAVFLETAQELFEAGLNIAVYSRDSYPAAFEQCVPVADQLQVVGPEVLPILLLEGSIKVAYAYPDREQLERFSQVSRGQAQAKTVGAGCGPGGQGLHGGPEIGDRPNLLDKKLA